jgi:UDP-glucose 4-epimerase
MPTPKCDPSPEFRTRGNRVLVTGAAGFIGSHVAEHCLKQGMNVTGVDDLSGGFIENLPRGVEFVQGDLRDPDFVRGLWQRRQFDAIYHLAAYAAEGLSHFVRRYNYQTNLVASVNLLNESIRHETGTFVFASSIAVYGAAQTPMTEDVVPIPEDPYGISKYAFELDLRSAYEMFGQRYVIFRPHNVYGERQNIADRYRNVVGIFMNQVLQGGPMTIFGDGLQTRAFSHVDDVAPIIARAPFVQGAENSVFNVGSDAATTVLELAHQVAKQFEIEPQIQYLKARPEVLHAVSSHARVRAVFAPPPPIPLNEGICRMAEWVRSRGPTRPVSFEALELTRNLPTSWRSYSSRHSP